MGGVLSPCMPLSLADDLKEWKLRPADSDAPGRVLSVGYDSSEDCCQGSYTPMSSRT